MLAEVAQVREERGMEGVKGVTLRDPRFTCAELACVC